jgi:hypothetical protein
MQKRVAHAASVYDPGEAAVRSAKPAGQGGGGGGQGGRQGGRQGGGSARKMGNMMKRMMGKGLRNSLSLAENEDNGGGNGSSRRKSARKHNTGRPPSFSRVQDPAARAAAARYAVVQKQSHEYMHLIETEARKLLEVQQSVMQASLHLEHIREHHGGYVTTRSVLNSGERGSKEAMAREKAFFEQHIANLEKEVVAANHMCAKETTLQAELRVKINEQRRLIGGKKKALIRISQGLQHYRRDIKEGRIVVAQLKDACLAEQSRMNRIRIKDKALVAETRRESTRAHSFSVSRSSLLFSLFAFVCV